MYSLVKRLLDVVLSMVGLIIFSPLMLITAIAIKLESPGPVIFKQERIGLNGKVFKIYKFRSMYVGAEKGGVYVTKGDPRVTRIGGIIRMTSIDELPQLVNILKGDMSIIGPRPPLTYHPWSYDEYSDEQKRMFRVRPGITGWAQVNGRKNVEWPRRIELNVEYVEKMSFAFDLMIFIKTIFKVIGMKDNINTGKTVRKEG